MPRAKAQGALRERKISPVRRVGPAQRLVLSGKIDRMGLAGSHFEMKDADDKVLAKRELNLPDHETALHSMHCAGDA
jgi:hypothetical protein